MNMNDHHQMLTRKLYQLHAMLCNGEPILSMRQYLEEALDDYGYSAEDVLCQATIDAPLQAELDKAHAAVEDLMRSAEKMRTQYKTLRQRVQWAMQDVESRADELDFEDEDEAAACAVNHLDQILQEHPDLEF